MATVVPGLMPRKHGDGQGLDSTLLSPRTNIQPWNEGEGDPELSGKTLNGKQVHLGCLDEWKFTVKIRKPVC